MTARTASCPECLGGKVYLEYSPECKDCGKIWLDRMSFDTAVKKAMTEKLAYLQSEIYKDLEDLVTTSKFALLDKIEEQISKSLGYAQEEFERLQNDSDYRKGVRVEIDVLDAVMNYLDELRKFIRDGDGSDG